MFVYLHSFSDNTNRKQFKPNSCKPNKTITTGYKYAYKFVIEIKPIQSIPI